MGHPPVDFSKNAGTRGDAEDEPQPNLGKWHPGIGATVAESLRLWFTRRTQTIAGRGDAGVETLPRRVAEREGES